MAQYSEWYKANRAMYVRQGRDIEDEDTESYFQSLLTSHDELWLTALTHGVDAHEL